MAAVDEKPTYSYQSLFKLTAHPIAAFDRETAALLAEKVIAQDESKAAWNLWSRTEAEIMTDYSSEWHLAANDTAGTGFARSVAEFCVSTENNRKLAFIATNHIIQLLEEYGDYTWISDSHARYYCVSRIIQKTIKGKVNPKMTSHFDVKSTLTALMAHQCADSKMTYSNLKAVWNKIPLVEDVCEEELAALDWAEKLVFSANSSSIKREMERRHRTMETGVDGLFDVKPLSVTEPPDFVYASRVADVRILVFKDEHVVCLMDSDSCQQVMRRASEVVCRRFFYIVNPKAYKMVKDEELAGRYKRRSVAYRKAENWIAQMMARLSVEEGHPGRLAKHCKSCLAAIVYSLYKRDESNAIKARTDECVEQMRAEAREALDVAVDFYQIVTASGADEEDWLDIAYVFHLCPGSDADPAVLFSKTVETMRSANTAKLSEKKAFLRYLKSYLTVILLHKGSADSGNIVCEAGYTFEDKSWYKNIKKGVLCMPPDEDLGKCWVEGALLWDKAAELWYLEARDVTHVSAVFAAEFPDTLRSREQNYDRNELTYVLRHGPVLSGLWTPTDARDHVKDPKHAWSNHTSMAAKAENTKFGAKVRETHSACDVWREMGTEIAKNYGRISACISGVSLRKPINEVAQKLNGIAGSLRKGGNAFSSSQDVSSWSPKADREFFFDVSDVLTALFVGEKFSLRDLWKETKFAIDKRGVKRVAQVNTGMIMGFTGDLDSILHHVLVGWVIRRAKQEGLLSSSAGAEEFATSLVMIDDAVMCVKLADDIRGVRGTTILENFTSLLERVYWDLGFEIDQVKSIFSTMKATYLNRVYAAGVEILTPGKLFAKIDREADRRMTSVLDQMAAVFSKAAAASERGADPIVAYKFAANRALHFMALSCPKDLITSPKDTAIAMRVPITLGGMGCPSIIELLSTARPDKLSSFFAELIATYSAITTAAGPTHPEAAYIRGVIGALVDRKFKYTNRTAMRILANPHAVDIEDVIIPQRPINELIKKCALKIAVNPEIIDVLNRETDDATIELIHCAMQCGSFDAACVSAVGAALPWEQFRPIMDKCRANAIVLRATSQDHIASAVKRMRENDKLYILNIFSILSKKQKYRTTKLPRTGYDMARKVRDAFFDSAGYNIVNHTIPPGAEHVMRTENPACMITVENVGLAWLLCSEKKKPDMYTGRSGGGQSHGIRSRKKRVSAMAALRNTPGPARKLALALMCCRWEMSIFDLEENTHPLEIVLSCLWTGRVDSLSDVAAPKWNSKSLKRMLNRGFVVNAPIFAFPNTQGSASVKTERYYAYLDSHDSPINGMTVLQELRLCGLLNSAIGFKWKTFRYDPIANMIPDFDDRPMPPTTSDDLIDLAKKVGSTLKMSKQIRDSVDIALDALRNVYDDMMESEEHFDPDAYQEKDPIDGAVLATASGYMQMTQAGINVDVTGVLPAGQARPVHSDMSVTDTVQGVTQRKQMTVGAVVDYMSFSGHNEVDAAIAHAAAEITRIVTNCVEVTMADKSLELMAAVEEKNLSDAVDGVWKRIYKRAKRKSKVALGKWIDDNCRSGSWELYDKEKMDLFTKCNFLYTVCQVRAGMIVCRQSFLAQRVTANPLQMLRQMLVAQSSYADKPWQEDLIGLIKNLVSIVDDKTTDKQLIAKMIGVYEKANLIEPWLGQQIEDVRINIGRWKEKNKVESRTPEGGRFLAAMILTDRIRDYVHLRGMAAMRVAPIDAPEARTSSIFHFPTIPAADIPENVVNAFLGAAPSVDETVANDENVPTDVPNDFNNRVCQAAAVVYGLGENLTNAQIMERTGMSIEDMITDPDIESIVFGYPDDTALNLDNQ